MCSLFVRKKVVTLLLNGTFYLFRLVVHDTGLSLVAGFQVNLKYNLN